MPLRRHMVKKSVTQMIAEDKMLIYFEIVLIIVRNLHLFVKKPRFLL